MKTKLHIFKTVAHYASFTKAAERLFISQPAVSKAIRNLEEAYKSTFFIRKRNSIELTDEGKVFLTYVHRILSVHAEIDDHFLTSKNTQPSEIKFGVSTTVASYVIPKVIANFRTQFPQTSFDIKSGNSEAIENLILSQELDFGITEGKNTNQQLQFSQFVKDEIVLVANTNNKRFKNDIVDKKMLQKLPFVMRELGSGTRDVIHSVLKTHQIPSLQTVVTLNSTEAIKHYLYYSDNYAFISIHAVAEDLLANKLKIIDVKGFTIERWFYFVSRTGYQSVLMDQFERFAKNNYNF
ncbi:MAG: LysR family transcriptional regulator [Flavobacteriaceae bacterium]|nr:MAG: LysR family transcriptional regulator [Flavobacteriaceae bacterium]